MAVRRGFKHRHYNIVPGSLAPRLLPIHIVSFPGMEEQEQEQGAPEARSGRKHLKYLRTHD